MILKRLFCKHEYRLETYYSLKGRWIKVFCHKCEKVKERILVEEHTTYEHLTSEDIEHLLNKGWNIGG